MAITVRELAVAIGGVVIGDGERVIERCNTLNVAGPADVSFLHNSKYYRQLEGTKAGCVILAQGATGAVKRNEGMEPLTAIEVRNPYYGWQQAVVKLHGYRKHPAVGISPQASIHPTAKIGANASIHAFVVIGEHVVIGDNANIYPHVTIMHGSTVGDDVIMYPRVTIYDDCHIGNRCILHAGTVVGSDGYGYASTPQGHFKIPQTGNVVLQDDVETGGNTVIERAVVATTVVGKGTKTGNCVVIGHNCTIGEHNLFVSQVGIAGSTSTGKFVVMGGQAGIAGHIHIPDGCRISAQAGVVMEPPEGTKELGGTPAIEGKLARRVYMQIATLPELAKRVKALEKQAGGGDVHHGDAEARREAGE